MQPCSPSQPIQARVILFGVTCDSTPRIPTQYQLNPRIAIRVLLEARACVRFNLVTQAPSSIACTSPPTCHAWPHQNIQLQYNAWGRQYLPPPLPTNPARARARMRPPRVAGAVLFLADSCLRQIFNHCKQAPTSIRHVDNARCNFIFQQRFCRPS